jgi:hypothetical protein
VDLYLVVDTIIGLGAELALGCLVILTAEGLDLFR